MNTIKIILGVLLLAFSLSFAADVSACGVINTPGTYNVVSDLTTAGGDCLVINADNVNLYCNGYSISATDGHSYAVYVMEGSDNVLVDRCLLENSMVGLRAGGTGSLTTGLTLRNNVARNNAWGYELIDLTDSLIEHNTAYENTQHGFYMTESTNNILSDNNEWLSSDYGFYLGSSSGNQLLRNTARQNGQHGFVVAFESNNNILGSNIAEQNDYSGFILYGARAAVPDGNLLTSNTANANGIGIRFEDTGTQNQVLGSTVSNNNYGGISATRSPGLTFSSNTITNNGPSYGLASGILVKECPGYTISDNTVSSSYHGVLVEGSSPGTLDNTLISDSTEPLTLLDSQNNELTAIKLENSGPVRLIGDASGNNITELTMSGAAGEVMVDIPVYDGDYEVTVAFAPAAAPSGYTALGRYVSVVNTGGAGTMLLGLHYQDSDLGSLDESTVKAMLWGGSWSAPAQTLNMGSNGVLMENPGFGTFGLFAGAPPTPPTPPTPPGGGGSSGGTTSGGTTHSSGSGAPHVGVPYVPGGTTTTATATTTTYTPSCTSDSDCAESAECSSGRCVALEAGSSCGAFRDHEWVDYECCGTEDCAAGEVCRENECVALEPMGTTLSGTTQPTTGTESSDQGLGRLLADIPWWVLLLLVLMVGAGIYARYRMAREEQPPEEEAPPAEPEEE